MLTTAADRCCGCCFVAEAWCWWRRWCWWCSPVWQGATRRQADFRSLPGPLGRVATRRCTVDWGVPRRAAEPGPDRRDADGGRCAWDAWSVLALGLHTRPRVCRAWWTGFTAAVGAVASGRGDGDVLWRLRGARLIWRVLADHRDHYEDQW